MPLTRPESNISHAGLSTSAGGNIKSVWLANKFSELMLKLDLGSKIKRGKIKGNSAADNNVIV